MTVKVANLEKGETWPGGLGSCLELFAFALSWLQNFFVADQPARNSSTKTVAEHPVTIHTKHMCTHTNIYII